MAIIGEIRKHSGLAVIIVGIAILAFIIGDLFKGNAKQPALGVMVDTMGLLLKEKI